MEKQFDDDTKEGRSRGVNDSQDIPSSRTTEATHARIHARLDTQLRNDVTEEQAGIEISAPFLSMNRPDPVLGPVPGPVPVLPSETDHTIQPDTSGPMTTDTTHPTSSSMCPTEDSAHLTSIATRSSEADYADLPEDLAGCSTIEPSVAIVPPQEYDILYGRGKMRRKHPGNKRMKLLVDLHRDAYVKANRIAKTNMSKEIVNIIKSSGDKSGRFLRFDKSINGWVEVSDEVAREKVSHALRDGKTKPLERIDPKVLDEIPLLSDQIKQDALRKLATSNPTGESFQSPPTAEKGEVGQTEPSDDLLQGQADHIKQDEMDQKPAAKVEDRQGVPAEY